MHDEGRSARRRAAQIRRRPRRALAGLALASASYPAGRYDDAVVASVRRAGYLAATTTNYGLASPRQGLLTLDRVRINGSDGVAGFASKLRALAA